MRTTALLALLLWQTASGTEPPVAQPNAMQYERSIHVPAGSGQACAVLDAQIFPHATPSLTDLRIFPQGASAAHEIPYAITLSEAISEETQPARVLNLGRSGAAIVFDLEMPARAYTSVTLDLDPEIHDFLATAKVSGSDSPGSSGRPTALGAFTLFDLASQRLSRDTTLPLQESTFKYLHITLTVSPAPGAAPAIHFTPEMVQGAEVPPSREAQTVYSAVAETWTLATVGRESRATFLVPARVPIERVSFALPPTFKGNFSRDVRITATTEPPANGDRTGADTVGDDGGRAPIPETVTGSILRVHTTEDGREIRSEELSVPAILGANLQRAAKVEVAIGNGDDQPLPVASVRLEMRQRKLCFDAPAAADGLALYYGDPQLIAPVYDYAKLFAVSDNALVAELGPEQTNPAYRAPADARSFTERHPEVLWIALIAVICALGVVALKSSRNVGV